MFQSAKPSQAKPMIRFDNVAVFIWEKVWLENSLSQ
jgi:hypothetical protein